MDNRQITVVLAEPSAIISAGFASVLANYNTFRIVERVSDLRFLPDVVARYSPEIIVVNPLLFDYKSKFSVRSIVSGTDGPALAALTSTLYDEMVFSQFDAVISIYDSPAAIIKSLRKAVDASKRGTSRLRNGSHVRLEVLEPVAPLSGQEFAPKNADLSLPVCRRNGSAGHEHPAVAQPPP